MYMQAVQAEEEAERERRAELREQAKAQKEFEAEMARLRKEQEHYRNVLEKMREQGNQEEAEKLKEKNVAVVEYRVEPEAEEYRISRRIAEKREQKQNIAGGE